MSSHERASRDEINNVTYQRCQFAYEYALDIVKGKKVLDLGCGLAYGTAQMASKALEVTGVDYDAGTISGNQQHYVDIKNLKFIRSAVPPLPFPDHSFDVVTMFQFIEHIRNRKELLRECNRVLKNDGILVVTTPNAVKSFARNPFHIHEYTFDEMKTEIQPVFPSFELKALKGNETVNNYYRENEKFVRRIMKWDVLKLHRIFPASLLTKPYNLVTTVMRKALKKNVSNTVSISTSDFFLDSASLNEGWDIYVLAKKNV
jgi:ubiquinone/menaquinone biosynthesis C-methylase UbiE